jgi:hypothetical protein
MNQGPTIDPNSQDYLPKTVLTPANVKLLDPFDAPALLFPPFGRDTLSGFEARGGKSLSYFHKIENGPPGLVDQMKIISLKHGGSRIINIQDGNASPAQLLKDSKYSSNSPTAVSSANDAVVESKDSTEAIVESKVQSGSKDGSKDSSKVHAVTKDAVTKDASLPPGFDGVDLGEMVL